MSRRFLPIPRKRYLPRAHRAFEEPERLDFIRSLPCMICSILRSRQGSQTEAAHIGQRGLGQKCADSETAPLCALHHRIGEHAHHRLGKRFWIFWNLDRSEVISRYRSLYEKTERAA
jgi:hypothetical protein